MNYSKTFVSFFFSKTSFQRNTRRVSFPKPAQPNKRRQIKPKNKCIHFFSPPHDLMAMAHMSMYGCRCGIFLPPSSPSTTQHLHMSEAERVADRMGWVWKRGRRRRGGREKRRRAGPVPTGLTTKTPPTGTPAPQWVDDTHMHKHLQQHATCTQIQAE